MASSLYKSTSWKTMEPGFMPGSFIDTSFSCFVCLSAVCVDRPELRWGKLKHWTILIVSNIHNACIKDCICLLEVSPTGPLCSDEKLWLSASFWQILAYSNHLVTQISYGIAIIIGLLFLLQFSQHIYYLLGEEKLLIQKSGEESYFVYRGRN